MNYLIFCTLFICLPAQAMDEETLTPPETTIQQLENATQQEQKSALVHFANKQDQGSEKQEVGVWITLDEKMNPEEKYQAAKMLLDNWPQR